VKFQKTVIFIDTALRTSDKYNGSSIETDAQFRLVHVLRFFSEMSPDSEDDC
jgi:hypothetical protein